jgi:hypothetical protein
MNFAFGETVTVLTAGTVSDPYSGEAVASWDTPTERDETCGVADGGSTEPLQDARNSIESDFDLIFDHDPAITAQDRVVVRGLTCEVVGRPFAWRSPLTGWQPGAIVKAKITEG